jgi:prophage DNA circulation protein
MPVFDQLQRASFDGIAFPVKSVSIKGRYRHHEHEYLRVPGAVIEKLERAVYNIEMAAVFDVNVRGYPNLWPAGINALQKKFETGTTGPLVIPTVGTIPAFQPEWSRAAEMGKVRSGETATLTFKEDQTQRFLQLAAVQTQQQSLATSLSNLNAIRASLNPPANDLDLFDKIQDLANGILAIKDQSDLYGGLLAARIGSLTALLNEADRQLESLKNPANHETLDAFLELWNATVNLGTNLAESPRGPRQYVTSRRMSVSDIATAVYGSSERASEILMNNRLGDPFAVPAGTTIIYFEDAGLAA